MTAKCDALTMVMLDAMRIQKLRLKKREHRDEIQKQGVKRQVRQVQISMGIGLAERSICAHNLLEYMDR